MYFWYMLSLKVIFKKKIKRQRYLLLLLLLLSSLRSFERIDEVFSKNLVILRHNLYVDFKTNVYS